jgi:hypothetical protein
MQKTLTGVERTWKLLGHARRFAEVTVTYSEASELFRPVPYNALNGRGEQRASIEPHLRKLKKAMESGEYTPTSGSVGLRQKHREQVTYEGGTFSLTVNSADPLPLTDAGHRLGAIARIVSDLQAKVRAAKDDQEKAEHQAQLEEALSLPITFTIHLDGDTQKDFVNLQSGRVVDRSHLFSLKVQQKAFADPAFQLAIDVARSLHRRNDSPFRNLIRFDSRGDMGMPINTLCAKGASDLATSLVGLAKVGLAATPPMDADALADCVVAACRALRDGDSDLVASGMPLAFVGGCGTRGSATLVVGLGLCLAYRGGEASLSDLVKVARETLSDPLNGSFPSSLKRQLMGDFARVFFAGEVGEKHDGLPIALLRTLSASAFAAQPLPKAKKKTKSELAAVA